MRISISIVVLVGVLFTMLVAAIIAFVPTYLVGVEGVQDTVVILRKNVIGRIDLGFQLFFRGPGAAANALASVRLSGITLPTADANQTINLLCRLLNDFNGLASAASVYTPTEFIVCSKQFGPDLAGSVALPQTNLDTYPWDMQQMKWVEPRVKEFTVTTNPAFMFAFFDQNVSRTERWVNVHGGLGVIQFSAATPLFDAAGVNVIGRLNIDIQPDLVNELLQNLGLLPSARAFAYDAASRRLFGNSWGAPVFQLLPAWADLSKAQEERMIFFGLDRITDPLVNKVIAELGGARAIDNVVSNVSATLFDGSERTYVDIKAFRDSFGLNIRVFVAMPEKDFLESIVTKRTSTIGGVVGALVGVMLICTGLSILLARPLRQLGNRMRLTASLQDSGDDDTPSMLSEVADMQEAYVTMKSELNRMKSYLPQSVLFVQDDDDDEEGSVTMSEAVSDQKVTQRSVSRNGSESSRTRSESHRSSQSGARSYAAGGVVHALNVHRGVVSKRVTVCAFNMIGFSGLTASRLRIAQQMQVEYLTVVGKHVQENRGVVDSFHGDRIVASFNALSTVASSSKRAIICALNATDDLKNSSTAGQPFFPVSVGISTRSASVGNMGNDTMQRFNILGSCYGEALAMERLGRNDFYAKDGTIKSDMPVVDANSESANGKRSIVISQPVIADAELEFLLEAFDCVRLSGGGAMLVARVHGAKTMSAEEWMYQLEEGEKADPRTEVNRCFHELINGSGSSVDTAALPDTAAAGRLKEFLTIGTEWMKHVLPVTVTIT